MFAKELITAYPQAKVILNKRPIEPWYQSLISSVAAIQDSWLVWLLMNMDYQTRYDMLASNLHFGTSPLIWMIKYYSPRVDQNQRPRL